MINPLDTSNVEQLVTNAPNLHAVHFWAEWYSPCRMMGAVLLRTTEKQ